MRVTAEPSEKSTVYGCKKYYLGMAKCGINIFDIYLGIN